MSGPLANIEVVDLSRVLAAPWAAQCLAHLGAEVTKVERPLKGDDSSIGNAALLRNPILFSETSPEYQLPLPILGEHTNDVLREVLGNTAAEVASLRAQEII